MSLKKSSHENYVLFLNMFSKMRLTPFTAKSFLKKVRPYCKTNHLNYKILFIRIRGSNSGITIEIKNDCFVIRQNSSLHEFIFYSDPKQYTSKQLIFKILKHNLLNP